MNIVVMGAGAWGTAIAVHMKNCGHDVSLFPRRREQAVELRFLGENQTYLPGIVLPADLNVVHELTPSVLEMVDCVFLACPSVAVRSCCEQLKEYLPQRGKQLMVVTLCKGLDPSTLNSPLGMVQTILPSMLRGALSGPTYAREVAIGRPAAMVLGVQEKTDQAMAVQSAVHGGAVRVYLSTDWRGVEMGGCLKNIYAIAAGICDGLKLGDNAKSALLTRSLQEIVMIGKAMGGREETFLGLSGLGDLMATSFGEWSRNRTFGEEIGKGTTIEELLDARKTVVEGYHTTNCFNKLRLEKGWDAPVLHEIHQVLYEDKVPKCALADLLIRPPKTEFSVG